jgi:hypothetical protein
MSRARGWAAIAGGFIGASLAVSLAITSSSPVDAAPPDAGVDAGAPMSPYLIKAGTGTVLPPSVDDAEAFCALALACLDIAMYPPAPDFQGCVNALMNQLTGPEALNTSLSIRECGLRATSCKSLRACALKGADATICKDVAMDTKEPIGKCDLDGRAVTCWRGKILGVRNCGLANEICVAKGGKAECALAGACPAGVKDTWSCAGTRMVKCENAKFLSIDCSVLNLGCVMDKGVAGCAPTITKACTSSTVTCTKDNDTAIGCASGKQVNVACSDQGMKCADPAKPATDRTVGVCELPVGDKPCDLAKTKAKCKGSTIEYCSHGTTRAFQCKTIGANKCVEDKGTGPRCTS